MPNQPTLPMDNSRPLPSQHKGSFDITSEADWAKIKARSHPLSPPHAQTRSELLRRFQAPPSPGTNQAPPTSAPPPASSTPSGPDSASSPAAGM